MKDVSAKLPYSSQTDEWAKILAAEALNSSEPVYAIVNTHKIVADNKSTAESIAFLYNMKFGSFATTEYNVFARVKNASKALPTKQAELTEKADELGQIKSDDLPALTKNVLEFAFILSECYGTAEDVKKLYIKNLAKRGHVSKLHQLQSHASANEDDCMKLLISTIIVCMETTGYISTEVIAIAASVLPMFRGSQVVK